MRLVAVMLVTLVMQSAAGVPLRLGPTGSHLTERDVDRIAQVVAGPDRPPIWILDGRATGFIPGWHVAVYLDPDHQTPQLRRGRVVYVKASTPDFGVYRATGDWTANEVRSYAQVPLPGPATDRPMGSRDLARPFLVGGEFTDAEIAGIVGFVRESPANPHPATARDGRPLPEVYLRVRGDWPVTRLSRDGPFVQVMLLDEKWDEKSGQVVRLERQEGAWVVRLVGGWTAD